MEWLDEFLFVHDTFVRTLLLDVILSYSLYVTFRAGMWSLAQGGVMAIATYAAAILTIETGWSFWLSILGAIGIATVIGTAVVLPTLRLQGAYLAIATIAFVELVRVSAINLEITGGPGGLSGVPATVEVAGFAAAAALVVAAVTLINRSRLGSAMSLHARSPALAQAVGVNVGRLRLSLLVISALIAAFGAALGAHAFRVVVPDTYAFEKVVELLAFVIVGGTASAFGPLVGVLVLSVPSEFIEPLQEYRLMFDGVLLLLAILFFPGGITSPSQYRGPRRLSSGGFGGLKQAGRALIPGMRTSR